MSRLRLILLLPILLLAQSCIVFTGVRSPYGLNAPYVPYNGWMYSNTAFPVDLTYRGTFETEAVGRSSARNILGLVSWGSATVSEAARLGQLDRVDHIEAEYMTVIGVYTETTIKAYGVSEEQRRREEERARRKAAATP